MVSASSQSRLGELDGAVYPKLRAGGLGGGLRMSVGLATEPQHQVLSLGCTADSPGSFKNLGGEAGSWAQVCENLRAPV